MTTGVWFQSSAVIAFTPSGSQLYMFEWNQLLTMPGGGGALSVLAGNGGYGGFADGQGTAAMFEKPQGLVIHPVTGVIYITSNNRVRICTPLGLVSTLVGTGSYGNTDGDYTSATFDQTWGIVMDPTNVYLYVTSGYTLRQIEVATRYTITIVGSGNSGFVDGTGLGASFYNPRYALLLLLWDL